MLSYTLYFRTNSSPGEIVSNLKISKAQKHHSGKYTCTVDQLATASVTLHILNGKIEIKLKIGATLEKNFCLIL